MTRRAPAPPHVRSRPAADAGGPGRWLRERTGGLRWLLGASYMRVTLAAVVVVELLGLFLLAQGVLYTNRRFHPQVAAQLAPVAADLLEADADPRALQAFIERPVSVRDEGPPLGVTVPRPPQGYTLVVDRDGRPFYDNRALPSADPTEPTTDAPPADGTSVRRLDLALVERAMTLGEPRTRQGLIRTMHAEPLRADDGRVIGALLQVSTLQPATPGLVLLGLGVLAVATVFVALIGTLFGLYASRPLARRIEELADAADAWSRGDFSRAVRDEGDDELGRLSRRLDRMAGQLRDLVRARQALAGERERTRIARELHDSVKQQVFAASMRLGAARTGAAASREANLAAAETLVRQAQQELSDLIHELRPLATDGRPLGEALRDLVHGYRGPDGPDLELDLHTDLAGGQEVGTGLYRIAQEALANALRHADAGRVVLRLTSERAEATLTVEDDGRGFDPEAARHLGVGLASMAARAEALGGRLDVRAGPGTGTRVVARVPLHSAPGAHPEGSPL